MLHHILEEPLWLRTWIYWMVAVNTSSLFFVRFKPARRILAAFIGSAITMSLLVEWNGYNRLLGLAHVLWWTPLLVYLHRIWNRLPDSRALHLYLIVLFYTNTASLVVDSIDVVRYLVGV